MLFQFSIFSGEAILSIFYSIYLLLQLYMYYPYWVFLNLFVDIPLRDFDVVKFNMLKS